MSAIEKSGASPAEIQTRKEEAHRNANDFEHVLFLYRSATRSAEAYLKCQEAAAKASALAEAQAKDRMHWVNAKGTPPEMAKAADVYHLAAEAHRQDEDFVKTANKLLQRLKEPF
jgi:hypothetical protein